MDICVNITSIHMHIHVRTDVAEPRSPDYIVMVVADTEPKSPDSDAASTHSTPYLRSEGDGNDKADKTGRQRDLAFVQLKG